MNHELVQLLGELTQHSSDAQAFSSQRRKVLAAYFASLSPASRSKLLHLQALLDARGAVAGTPDRAIGELMGELSDRCHALLALNQRLNEMLDLP